MTENPKIKAKKVNPMDMGRIVALVAVMFFLFMTCNYGFCGFFTSVELSFMEFLPKIIIVVFMVVLVKIATSSIKLIIKRRSDNGNEFGLEKPLNYIRYILWIVFFVIATTIIFDDIGALLTSLGLIGFGITFALQKPIMNFVGWVTINYHKTFGVGDRIRVGDFNGDVQEIKVMHTVIKSMLKSTEQYSGKLVHIPNEMVLVQPVENFTKDNNFLKNEIRISITYESDWKRAKGIFEDIVNNVTRTNIHKFRNNMHRKISIIDTTIVKLSKRFERAQTKQRGEKLKEQISVLEKEKKTIQDSVEEMPDQFRPTIHIDLDDSSITLSAFFLAPYDMQRQTRTEINSRFLEGIKRDPAIEIAYPHMHLVTHKQQRFTNKDLSSYLGIENLDPDKE